MSAKVAIIGSGWSGRVQIPAFQAAGLEVVGLAGRSPDKTKRIAQDYGIPVATTRWQELLELDCQLICVTTPPPLHREQAVSVLDAGKHLLCEKPMALNVAEAEAMVEAAARHDGQLALLDHELRFLPTRRKAKELLEAGAIGRILAVTARVANDSRLEPDVPWSWWSDAAQGGGILGALGSHVFDGIRWLLGDICGEVRVRGATLGRAHKARQDGGTEREVTADDLASVTFSVGEAIGTALIHGAAGDAPIDLLTFRGTEGTLVIDTSLKLYLSKGRGPLKEYVTTLPGIVPNRFRANPFAAGTVLLAQALAGALEQNSPAALAPAATLRDGLAVQRILDDARRLAAK